MIYRSNASSDFGIDYRGRFHDKRLIKRGVNLWSEFVRKARWF